MLLGATVRDRVLGVLQEATDSAEVLSQPDVPLYGTGLLDSLGTVTLIVAVEEAFGLTISPAEFDRQAWATPARFVADIERRLASAPHQQG
jgi:D-alanine--poly(phosphoribitol) ligase subunit 2